MKLLFEDRSPTPVPKSVFVTMKQAAFATLRRCFDQRDLSKIESEISLSLVSNDEMQELNKRYREKDAPTDVLSFPALETPGEISSMGDIVISTETAAHQAAEAAHSLERELAFLTIHGVLHLLGLDHEVSQEDAAVMDEIQAEILDDLGGRGCCKIRNPG